MDVATLPEGPVLAVLAHPDDELFVAGLLIRCAQAGRRVVVVMATRGEAGASLESGLPSPGQSLGALRAAEAVSSCQVLGTEPPRFLGFTDGALVRVQAESAGVALNPILAEVAPSVLVTFGADGLYGHLDHLTVTGWLDAAVRAGGAVEGALLLHAAFPSGLFSSLRRRLSRSGLVSLATADAAAHPGMDPDRADLVIELTPAEQQRKRRAICCHRSQLRNGDPDSFLLPGLVQTLLPLERYVNPGSATPAR